MPIKPNERSSSQAAPSTPDRTERARGFAFFHDFCSSPRTIGCVLADGETGRQLVERDGLALVARTNGEPVEQTARVGYLELSFSNARQRTPSQRSVQNVAIAADSLR